ncbi:MAG: P-II family nitrogen regulator [Myxococcales bacterium]|nr:P-II family nitrogen regulator [Myxococcales bacterium]MCB9749560.1 P-II family nitrogen regulator [Myxococcales bacterium]
MKLIVAIVKPEKLDVIRQALMAAGVAHMTVSRATGHGKLDEAELYRGVEFVPDLTPKVRLEIAVAREMVETTINAIVGSARSHGERGDGKIFVLPLEQCVRIRTGEQGPDAL